MIQRVTRASVTVGGTVTGQIGKGLLVLIGVGSGDSQKEALTLLEKLVNLRIFADADGKMNLSAVQLGASSLKDLALALFVGMAAGAYSSIFIATPLLVQLKANETAVQQAERRAQARRKALEADRYAAVPVFREDLPVRDQDDRDDDLDDRLDDHGDDAGPLDERDREDASVAGGATAVREPRRPEAMNRGRVVPPSRGPVRPSGAAGRQQPTRQPRSKRGKR